MAPLTRSWARQSAGWLWLAEKLTLAQDLYNFQVSLQKIDSMRVGGKFVDSEGNKPSGQLVLLYLLRRCYGLIYRCDAARHDTLTPQPHVLVRAHLRGAAADRQQAHDRQALSARGRALRRTLRPS